MDEIDNLEDMDENSGSGESAAFRALRDKNKELAKKVAEFETVQAEAEAAAQTRRAEAVKGIVNSFNLPGLADDVLSWVEGDITEDSVKEALKVRSIPIGEAQAQSQNDTSQTVNVSDVGQKVADAAGGVDRRSVDERINAAENPQELAAIMAEAGLVRSHS